MIGLSQQQREFFLELFGNKRDVLFPEGNMLHEVIDLSVANTLIRKDFAGDFIYASRNTTGVVDVQINSLAMPKFPFGQNTTISGFPYKTLYLSWEAQAGLVMDLWYGYGAKVIPPNQDIASILNTVNIMDAGNSYGVAFNSNAALTAGTPLNILSAGSNTGGARVSSAFSYGIGNTGVNQAPQIALMAKATAPANVNDGDVLCFNDKYALSSGVVLITTNTLPNPLRIGSGMRLDWISDASISGTKTVLYTLL